MESKLKRATGEQTDTRLSDWLENLREYGMRQPQRNAVLGDDFQLNHGDLELHVDSLCRRLHEVGTAPGDRIAICLSRSPLAVVAFLAVLRVGGTYVPIDMEYSSSRLSLMLGCEPDALITTAPLKKRLPEVTCPTIFIGDRPVGQKINLPENFVPVPDEFPAYLMFTSGSTGSSQGVVVSRGALARYVVSLDDAFDITGRDVYLHTASFSFSASIRQIMAPLAARATMVIADEEAKYDPFRLLELMKTRGVTVWDTVPSLWRAVERLFSKVGSQDRNISVPATIRLVLLTGEPLAWELVFAWRSHLKDDVNIINLYSQTETAGTVSIFPIPAGTIQRTGVVPLGKPLHDVNLLVLDDDLHPVPPGNEGEVHVASDRLADGYRDDRQLTENRFLADIDVERDYNRVYRTGDFVRVEPDGSLIPVGRRDHRVKIRGFRVDLLEVEIELAKDPRVEQAVVLTESSNKLVAYVTPATEEISSQMEIQNRLRKILPDYAVPGQIIVVDRIPMTASGKVDRKALTERQDCDTSDSAKKPEAMDHTEADLLQIWEDMLGYNYASLDDDFFEKGGDSLTAVSLFLEIENRFGVRLPPSTLFSAGTVRGLAPIVRSSTKPQPTHSVLELRKKGNLPPLFLVHAIWAHIPHFRNLVELLDPELAVYALEPIRNSDALGREPDVGRMVKQYAREIRTIHPQGPFFLAGWSIGGFMALSVAAELESRGDEPGALMLIDSASPSLRPMLRQQQAQGIPRLLAYLRKRVQREIQALRLSPRQQRERFEWIFQEQGRKLRLLPRRAAHRKLQARLHEEFKRIVDQYKPRPYRGPVTLFRSEQKVVDPDQDEDLGWGDYIDGDLEIVRMPGDHNSIVIEPQNTKILASHITGIVNTVSKGGAGGRQEGTRDDHALVDQFLAESRKLSGQKFTERVPWNNEVTRDAIRHFAFGICDDNPLWIDEKDAPESPPSRKQAPPAFLVSARYPVLHGAPIDAPLISLLRDMEFTWERRVFEGEQLQSSTEQGEVREVVDPGGNRRIYIESLTTYRNAGDQLLARARSTVVRMLTQGDSQIDDWSVHRYRPDERERIIDAIQGEARTGSRVMSPAEFSTGTRLPEIVRGPLTIGDMVCWHSAIGPSYRPGPLGYKDTLDAPEFRVRNPLTGWPIKYMLQHEDVNLAHQRGMPAPFDNGVMRFAWVSPLVTNWMGDHGFLARLHVTIHLPVFYGDTCWYSGEVTNVSEEGDSVRVRVRISGTNQRGSITTSGSAEVLLPSGS
jgi:aspartate racemase